MECSFAIYGPGGREAQEFIAVAVDIAQIVGVAAPLVLDVAGRERSAGRGTAKPERDPDGVPAPFLISGVARLRLNNFEGRSGDRARSLRRRVCPGRGSRQLPA